MATARTATVVETRDFGAETRVLSLVTDEPLGFVGGQYVIIDSGVVLPSGKAAKRAYSILSADADQRRVDLAVMRIPAGPCSGFLHHLAPSDAISFSGPWGKFHPAPDAQGRTLVVATDTGITAALGLLQGARIRPILGQTVVRWLRMHPDYFLPEAFVRARIPAGCDFAIEAIPAIGHPERVPHARHLVRALLAAGAPAQAFIAGDGAINYALLDDLVTAGVPANRDSVDSFFNMPKKSA